MKQDDVYQALNDLYTCVIHAIQSGDWKVDGACDPDLELRRTQKILEKYRKVNPQAKIVWDWVKHELE